MIINHEIYKPLYQNTDKPILLITGGRGCETPTQEIIMADLTVKQIKDVKVGDYVMGDDCSPRKVLDTMHGFGKMYHVHQTSAEDYWVNDAHILTLHKSRSAMEDKGDLTKAGTYRRPNGRYPQYGEFADIPVETYYNGSKHFRENFRGYKIDTIHYAEQPISIDPYLLGLWLGDGTAISTQITTPDIEIKEYLREYAASHGMVISNNGTKGEAECLRLRRVDIYHGTNPFYQKLKSYNLINNKHIPQEYISNSEEVRLQLLAGLLDTDGHMDRNGYEIVQKNYTLAKQIKYLADTLGFRTSMSMKRAHIGKKDCGIYYRIFINGDTWKIPCKVERKKVTQDMCHKNKDWHLSYLTITEAGYGEWCGICLDGNQRYLHADGTVTHNSGKSFATSAFIERLTFELKKNQLPDGEVEKIVHNILYCRYTMVSANISVIPEFMEKIDMDGTTKYFTRTKSDVTNIMTGSRIMFRGIKTSSGNQTAKLKSIHGITTFVCDEAEEWSNEQEFDTIALSIRQKGIQNRIIIIMNPTDSNHFIYQKYIKDTHIDVEYDGVPVQISTHPDVLHIHTTYLDNIEHLSDTFLKEVQTMKETNHDKYAHVVMGKWSDVAEGAIFKKWSVIKEMPSYKELRWRGRGLDFGYSTDPSACVYCGIDRDNNLYIDEQFYETGLLPSEIIRKLKSSHNAADTFVYADCADPQLIDEIFLGGVMIYGSNKSGGLSIMAGLEKMKDFNHIYITERSYNVQNEFRNYTLDKDKNGNYINQPIDAWNHSVDAARYYIMGRVLGLIVKPKKNVNNIANAVVF